MRSTIIRASKAAGFLLFAAFANPLTAQTETDYSSGWYLGGNIGMSTTNIDEEKITQNLTGHSYTDDDRDLGYKLFGGYQFNKYFALEGGYFNLGKFDYSLSTPTRTSEGSVKVMGVNLDAVGILPVAEDFAAFARVGAHYAQTKASFSGVSMADSNPKESDLNYKFGVGLQYAVTDAVGVRLEAERYRINDAVGNDGDIDLFSIGLTYRFGTKEKAAPVSEHKEAIAPVAEEELVLVTAPDAQEKIRKTATREKAVTLVFENIHFEREKSTLSKEAKDSLKKDIAQLGKNPKIKMRVSGHASQSGTKEYNQDLSERRAQTVKDYIVQEKLVPADKISVVGYGERRPAVYEAKPKNVNSKAAQANMRVLLKITYK